MKYSLDYDYLVNTLRQLVKINSVNPSLTPGAPGEVELGNYIASQLLDFEIDADIEVIATDRVNVTSLIKGSGSGPSLMLNVHMDTVGVSNMQDPFSALIKDGKLFGRGSYDTKAGIAAILTMVKALSDNNIQFKGDLLLAFVADEEYGSIGTEHLLKKYVTDSAIVLEPTNLDICLSHKGYGLFEFTSIGKAAHGGKPQEGIDANKNMGRVMAQLDLLSDQLAQSKGHHLLGNASMHIPLIKGGSEPFTYSDNCTLLLERRTLPGETQEEILAVYQSILDNLADSDSNFVAKVEAIMWREPYEITQDKEIVVELNKAITQATDNAPAYIAHSWWEDSGLTGKAGIDTVVLGPIGAGLHTNEEWVDLESVHLLAKSLLNVSISYLGQKAI